MIKIHRAPTEVELPPADVKDADAQWVTWQVRGDTEAMRSTLGLIRLGRWNGNAGAPKVAK